jgi:nitroimidazol reductase NimA-like FMN-containing flavoprotein (pyridoxamine 5'-phosphate oxidase superfamily)
VGRLAIDIAGKPDIFPINFIVDDGSLVFQTGAGTKFAASALLHHVAFEIDGYEPQQRTAWSVVVKGRAHQIERMQDVFAAQDLPLFPWAAHPKPNFVKISPTEITGRRFHIVDHVSPDASIGWEADQQPTSGDAVVPEPGAEFHPGAPNVRPG